MVKKPLSCIHIFIGCKGNVSAKSNLIESVYEGGNGEISRAETNNPYIPAGTILLTFLYNLRSIIQVCGHKFSFSFFHFIAKRT